MLKFKRYFTINYKKSSLWSILLNKGKVGETWITRIVKRFIITTRQRAKNDTFLDVQTTYSCTIYLQSIWRKYSNVRNVHHCSLKKYCKVSSICNVISGKFFMSVHSVGLQLSCFCWAGIWNTA